MTSPTIPKGEFESLQAGMVRIPERMSAVAYRVLSHAKGAPWDAMLFTLIKECRRDRTLAAEALKFGCEAMLGHLAESRNRMMLEVMDEAGGIADGDDE